MRVKEGAWINVQTGKYLWITEHATWVQDHGNARAIGLPDAVWEQIKDVQSDFSGPNRVRILFPVMDAGFIRIRGYGIQFSFEFTCAFADALKACCGFLEENAGPLTWCAFNNLRTSETVRLTYADYTGEDQAEILRRVTRFAAPPTL